MTQGISAASTSATQAQTTTLTGNYKNAKFKEKVQEYVNQGMTETAAVKKVKTEVEAKRAEKQKEQQQQQNSIFQNNNQSQQNVAPAYTAGALDLEA